MLRIPILMSAAVTTRSRVDSRRIVVELVTSATRRQFDRDVFHPASTDIRRKAPAHRPREHDGGRLVAGQHEGHHLVAELAVGHARAGLLVAGDQEHREQVALLLPRTAARLDDVVHDAIEHGDRAL